MAQTFTTAGDVVVVAPPATDTDSAADSGIEKAVNSSVSSNNMSTAHWIQQKYQQERNKRIRSEGIAQYIEPEPSGKFRHFQDDPWIDGSSHTNKLPFDDSTSCKFLILGAGFGGLLFAVRLIQAGMNVNDIRILDSAGGFGGTWYWNRYPGLKCDVESYIYMPLLEETGYMPKNKYADGNELREYANLIADKWGLRDKAIFGVKLNSSHWDTQKEEWVTKMMRSTSSEKGTELMIRSSFVIAASGLLNLPKLPNLQGIEQFQGHSFHTSRWDYKYTGGSPTDTYLRNLHDKRVGIIGTGATAVQAVPHLAAYAQHLYVFQRTPSSVDRRDNYPTDSTWWAHEIQNRPGWQAERMTNFNAFISNVLPRPETNMVNDAWSKIPSYSGLVGGPKHVSMETIPSHVAELYALDLPRSEGVRARVDEIVHDKKVAEKLKAWYPAWCKRPCFSDEYLPTFNRPNVTLVDTDGKGIESVTSEGIIADGAQYKLDLVIFSTGFRPPGVGSPASRANMAVIGRGGKNLETKFTQEGVGSLHGVISRDFPNFFFPGPLQAAATANQMSVLDTLSRHVAYIIAESIRGYQNEKVVVEPSQAAEEEWSMRIMAGAASLAGLNGCTPGYLNREGEIDRPKPMEEMMKSARGSIWGQGITDYMSVIEEWRTKGGLSGLEVGVGA